MADLLKIKKGLFANLKDQAIIPGTIYVATDEKTMYVDVVNAQSKNERIRVSGNLLMVKDLAELKPPFSSDVIYFVEKYNNGTEDVYVNALLRYVDDNVKFVHLNKATDLSSVQSLISALTTRVDKAEENITENTKDITALDTAFKAHVEAVSGYGDRITAVENQAKTNAADITSIKEVNTAQQTKIDGNTQSITDLTNVISANKTEIENSLATEKAAREAADKAINDKLGSSTDASNTTTAFKRIEALEAKDSAFQTSLDALNSSLSTAQADITAVSGRVGAAEEKITALQNAVGDATGIADRLTAVEVLAQEGNDKAVAAQTTADEAKEAIATLEKTVEKNKNEAATDRAAIRAAFAEADTAIKSDVSAIDARLKTAEANITEHKTQIDNLDSKIDTEITTAKKELTNDITEKVNAVNAMTYKDGVATYAELPTTGVHIGDTYVFTKDILDDAGNLTYSAGDMMIATGKEDETGVITSGLSWTRVQTGYQVDQDPSLTGEANQIVLKNFLGTSLGKITFAQPTEAEGGVKATVTADTVNLELVWGSF